MVDNSVDDVLSGEIDEVRSAITRRAIAFTYQSLTERYESSKDGNGKRNKRLAELKKTTAEGGDGIDVLKNKLKELALKVYDEETDDIIFKYLAYVMAALAGQPGKEILVVNSKEAAASVSYHILRYLGFRPIRQVSDSPKKQKRTNYYPEWKELIEDCKTLAGINQTFEKHIAAHWVQTDKPSDAGLEFIKKTYPNKKWCQHYAIGVNTI